MRKMQIFGFHFWVLKEDKPHLFHKSFDVWGAERSENVFSAPKKSVILSVFLKNILK